MTYQLIDCGAFQKLEQVGPYRIIRPSPQAVWSVRQPDQWQSFDAQYTRFSGGQGEWTMTNTAFQSGCVVELLDLQIQLKPTEFGHLGIFPEQRDHWQRLHRMIRASDKPLRVLNLFAYTGIASLICAHAGAEVVHLDASKASVAWARENAEHSRLTDKPIRWICDDVGKFVKREIKRGQRYDIIVLDPPSYGRGTKNEVWKIEEDLVPLLEDLKHLMSDTFASLLLSAHSPGYSPLALENLSQGILTDRPGVFDAHEMFTEASSGVHLPGGAACLYTNSELG